MKHLAYILALIVTTTICYGQKPSQAIVKSVINQDSAFTISKEKFDSVIDGAIYLLETKKLKAISDTQHITIMRCFNTLSLLHKKFTGGRYDKLRAFSDGYAKDIINVYREWGPNRGFGYYFVKLRMELYGCPSPYATFNVTN